MDAGRVVVDDVETGALRLTWSDFAMDDALALYIDRSGATAVLVQPGPVGRVDAIGADRQLVLTLDPRSTPATFASASRTVWIRPR